MEPLSHSFNKQIYGQRAAAVWNEVTGDYPSLPDNLDEGQGAVLMRTGQGLTLVGFFGFDKMQDQVVVFREYIIAERFYNVARRSPRIFMPKPLPKILLEPEDPKKKVVEEAPRPKRMYEGTGLKDE